MREPGSDRVRDAFADLTDSIDPSLRPPGVTSVRETVRRRRQRRLGGTAAAVLAVAGVVALVRLPLMEQPAHNMAEPPAVGVTTMPSGVLRPPLAPPTSAPTATATPPPSPVQDAAATRTSPPTRADETAIPPPPCTSPVTAAATGSQLVISAGPFCSGDEIVVSWATYETQRDGSQKLFASERHTLTEREPRVTTRLRESPTCVGPWYALRADPPIPATIAAGEVEPFPSGAVLASEDGEICLS